MLTFLYNNSMKTFSIITPVYNGQQFIQHCIEKIATANYDLTKIEHIVVDDGSTDNTKQICEELAKKYPHVKFYSKPNSNWGSVINYVKNNKLVHNDYVVVCDADDVILPDAFKTVDEKCKDADFCSGSFYLWNGAKKKTKVFSYYFLFKRNMLKKSDMQYYSPLLLPHCSYIKKEIFYSLPDLKERVSYQDTILYFNAFKRAKTLTFIPKGISLYWQKREGNTMSNIANTRGIQMQLDNLKYFESNNQLEPFFYVLLGLKPLRKYIKENNLYFTFENKKMKFSGFPFYVRPILHLIYLMFVKRFVNKK